MVASAPFKAHVLKLGELFSDRYRFRLPHFQRAYVWGTAQVGRLMSNLVEASRRPPDTRHYCLGGLLLARSESSREAAVVDGHQRLVTLTIMFAVLRDLAETSEERARFARMIRAESAEGIAGDRLLESLGSVAAVLDAYVQRDGATGRAFDRELSAASETEANVITNRDFIRGELTDTETGLHRQRALVTMLCDHCLVFVHEVGDEQEAWSMLEIEEQTRLAASPTDQAKASMLSVMSANDRDVCGPVWDDWQARLGSDDMYGLLGHVRTLARRRRSDMPLESQLIRDFGIAKDGRAFFDRWLLPRAAQLLALREGRIGTPDQTAAIQSLVQQITWIELQLWVPAAMVWLDARGDRHREALLFFSRLERLVWMMRIAGVDTSVQQNRIIALLPAIEAGTAVDAIKPFAIERKMLVDAMASLRSKSILRKSYSNAILRRICVAGYGRDPGPLDRVHVTIEHVLPRNPLPGSAWLRDFGGRKQVQDYANRLGNLAFLSARLNQEVGASDWAIKRPMLQRASGYDLALAAAEEPQWNKATIERRTEAMIAVLLRAWGLSTPD